VKCPGGASRLVVPLDDAYIGDEDVAAIVALIRGLRKSR
jgi:hypothetical protein